MRLLGVIAASILIIAACSANVTPAPTPTPLPTAVPTPSPTPFDLTKAFLGQLVSLSASGYKLAVSGTLHLGPVDATFDGSSTYVRSDSDETFTVSIGAVQQTTAKIHKSGVGYTKLGDLWFQDETPPAASKNLSSLFAALASLTETGTETKGGRLLHRLEVPAGIVIDPAALGFTDPSIQNPTITLVFYAADDGTPVFMTLNGSWTQSESGQPLPVTATIDFEFVQIGGELSVNAPEQVWIRYSSKRFHYSMAHPDDWDVDTSDKDQDVFVPQITFGPAVFIDASRGPVPAGLSLGRLVRDAISYEKTHYAATLDSNSAYVLDGTSARLLSFHETDQGTKVVLYDVLALKGSYFYVLAWESPKGHEADDLAFFREFLSTFNFR